MVSDGMNLQDRVWSYANHHRGFDICRALAIRHPEHCRAVHTANPVFAEPNLKKSPLAFFKYNIAKWTKSKLPSLSFGYLPSELRLQSANEEIPTSTQHLKSDQPLGPSLHRLYSSRPQTLSFSLCDSPVGLLAALLDVIHTRAPSGSPMTSRSRSPFLSPVELEMHTSNTSTSRRDDGHIREVSDDRPPKSPYQGEMDARNYTW